MTGTKSSGSRLFANCIVAVDASTGQYVWHYQTATPPSGAEEFHILVANLVVNGNEERVVMTVPRNGVFYTLDVRTGNTILPPRGIDGQAVGTLNQIDLKTLAASSPNAADSQEGAVWEDAQRTAAANAPVTSMGHAWFPMAYNAQTGLVYIPAYETPGRGATQDPTLEADQLAAKGGTGVRTSRTASSSHSIRSSSRPVGSSHSLSRSTAASSARPGTWCSTVTRAANSPVTRQTRGRKSGRSRPVPPSSQCR